MSPGWAVQVIYWETKDLGRNTADWAMRFLEMKPSDYSIRWDVSMDVWSIGGAVEFSGRDIAHMCACWVAKGFDFEKHNEELLPDFGGQHGPSEEEEPPLEASDDEFGTEDFPLPPHSYVVRYAWLNERDGHVFQRYLDIRLAEESAGYEFSIQEEGNPELIAFSERPVDRYLLELQLYAGLLPISASAPYIVDSDSWHCFIIDNFWANLDPVV